MLGHCGTLPPMTALAPPTALPLPVTLSTGALSVGTYAKVVTAVRMAAWAVGLAGCLSRWGLTTQNVDAIGHWFQMRGANTIPHATKMIDSEAIRDGANPMLISPTVSADRMAINPKTSIPMRRIGSASPEPASVSLPHFGQESSFNIHGHIVSHSASVGHQQLAPALVGCRASHAAGDRREPNKQAERRRAPQVRQPMLSAARKGREEPHHG